MRLAALALDLARTELIAEGRRRNDQLDRLLTTARRVAESLDLETVLASIIEDATTLLGADSGDMLLWDRERDTLRVVAVAQMPRDMIGFELRFGEGLSSQAILAQHPIEVDELRRVRAPRAGPSIVTTSAASSARRSSFGARRSATLNVHSRTGEAHFPAGAADLLAAFAGHAATAIEHARRYENEVRLGRVLADTNRELSRSLTVQQRLAEQVILDAGPAGIATVLAEHLGRRVVIQDHLHRLIAGAAPDGGDAWRRSCAQRRISSRMAPRPSASRSASRCESVATSSDICCCRPMPTSGRSIALSLTSRRPVSRSSSPRSGRPPRSRRTFAVRRLPTC